MPSGLHGVRCMGMPPTRLEAVRTTVGRSLSGKHAGRSLTWRLATHECGPDTHVQSRTHRGMGGGSSVGRAAGRCRFAQGLEKVSGPTGAIIMCSRQLGWTWPHHTTFVTASGHKVDLRQICRRDVKAQATVDSELAPLERVGPTTTNGRSCSRPFCWNLGSGCDTIGLVDAGDCAQGGNC